jgi:thiol-disulfide isomerase/thioredoxin
MDRGMNTTTNEASGARDRRAMWWVLIALVAAWSAYLAVLGPRAGSGPLPEAPLKPPFHPKRAEFRWTLRDLDGKPVELDAYRGRTIVLNLWATWCPPCVAEMPSLESLASNGRLKDVAFLCVAVNDDPGAVRSFVESRSLKVPVLVADDAVPEPFLTQGIPATFIIAPSGAIVVERVGSARWDAPKVVEYLERLAKGGPPPG